MKIYEHPKGLLIEFDKEIVKRRKKNLTSPSCPYDPYEGDESYGVIEIIEDCDRARLLVSPSRRFLPYV